MNKNSPELTKIKSAIFEPKINENNQQKNYSLDKDDATPCSAYEMSLFKKRIMWQATIFALKIVIPVVIFAIIFIDFLIK